MTKGLTNMRKKILPLLLILGLLLSIPVSALSAEDFKQGQLSGMTATDDGAYLVTDTFNKVVWRVEGDKVTQYAGAISVAGLSGEPTAVYHDSAVDKAYFMEPWDIVPFLDGYAVSDAAAHVVRYIVNGRVYTLAGTGKVGRVDGTGRLASFDRPAGLAVDRDGVLYVADAGNGSIRRIAQDGKVTTVASGLTAPTGLCWYNGALYVAETGRSRIVRVANERLEVFAGISEAAQDAGEYIGGYSDGPVATARFDHPQGIAAGADGTLYVSDTGNSAVRAISGGRVYTLARSDSSSLMPSSPRGLRISGDTLYVADQFAGSILTLSVAKKTYSDVPAGAWFADSVAAATQRGIANGTTATRFEPDGALSRAMFVTMLSRVHRNTDGSVIIDGESSLSDVPDAEWYSAPARWAIDAGIVTGDSGRFAPLRSISREELATMLYRYAKAQDMNVSASDAKMSEFDDAAETSDWAVDAMRWACERGIVNGTDGLLQPKATATRAQALKMLVEFMDTYGL